MSNVIDSRVVEMRFDNSHFENNVRSTMSTLDKLKAALHLDGASQGLDNLNNSINKVNFNPIGDGVEAVKVKFSALEIMAITALQNITNSVVNAGKKLVSEFTIEPVKTGFNEFELKMGSVQTILASTGESLDTVNEYLQELNVYSDKTIYSFKDMTSNIGKFTNAGVKLEDAVAAIKGISNEAAVSGANAQEASRAMYNFSQALSAGAVKLIDWKSIENANMATVEFKQTLMDTGVALGTLVKDGDNYITTTTDLQGKVSEAFNSTKMFNESLSHQWMTTEVLTTALSAYSTDVREMTDEEKKLYEEKLRGIGYTEEQIKSLEELGMKAFDSAQDIKTFSMMMDTLKEAAQSGWAQTWELIIGDFEQGKKLWTSIGTYLGDLIGKISDARNAIIEGALGKTFRELGDIINGITDPIKDVVEPIENVTKSLEELDAIADRVIRGEFGNMTPRWNALTEAGYNWVEVQNKVNEKLGLTYRHTEQVTDAQNNQADAQANQTDATTEQSEAISKLDDAQKENIKTLVELSEAELKAMGCTEDQLEAIRSLKDLAEKTGIPISRLIDHLDELDGRWIVFDSLKVVFESLKRVVLAVKNAFRDIFPPMTSERLFELIEGFSRLVREFKLTRSDMTKLRRTFAGFFAIVDLIGRTVKTVAVAAFKLLSSALGGVNGGILDTTANIGDAIVAFHDWIIKNDKITEGVNILIDVLTPIVGLISAIIGKVIELVSTFANWVSQNEKINSTIESASTYFSGAAEVIGAFVDRTKQLDGLTLANINAAFTDFIENVLGYFLNAPIGDALDKLSSFKNGIVDFVTTIGNNLKNKVNIGEILTILLGGSLTFGMAKFGSIAGALAAPLEALGEVLEKFASRGAKLLNSLTGAIKSFSFSLKAKSILMIAGAIGVLAASIWLLSTINSANLWESIAAIAALSAILIILAYSFSEMNSVGSISISGDGIKTTFTSILSLAAAIGVLVIAMKIMDTFNPENIGRNIGMVVGLLLILTGVATLLGKFSSLTGQITVGSISLLIMATALNSLVLTLVLLDKIPFTNLQNSMLALYELIGLLSLMGLALGTVKFGSGIAILAMAASLIVMIAALKMLDGLVIGDYEGLIGKLAIVMISLLALAGITHLVAKEALLAGVGILAISVAMYILTGLVGIIGNLGGENLAKANGTIIGLLSFFAILMVLSKFAGQNAAKAGLMILAMAGSIVLLTGVIAVLGALDPLQIAQGITALAGIMSMFALLLVACKFARNIKLGPMVALAVTIGVLMVALGALAMIDDVAALYSAAGAISVVLLALAATMYVIGKINGTITLALGTLVAMTVAIGIIGGVLIALSAINSENTLTAAGAIGLVMLALAATMYVIGGINQTVTLAIGTIVAMTVAIAILGGLLIALSVLNPEGMIPAAGSLGLLMLALAAAMYVIGSTAGTTIAGAVAMDIMAVGLIAIAAALNILNGVSWDSVLKGLAAMAIALLGLLATVAIMEAFAAGALTLTVVLIGFGAAVLLAGLGAIAFAAAIAIVTPCLPALGEGIAAVGEGLASFIITLANCNDRAGDFSNVMVTVGTSILSCLASIALGMLCAGAAGVVLAVGLVAAGAGLVVASVGVIAAALAIALLGLAIQAFVTSVGSAFATVSELFSKLGEAGENAGAMLVTGFANGVTNMIDAVVNAGKTIVDKVASTITTLLDINSPSRVAYLWGQFTGEGFSNGLSDSAGGAEEAASGFVDKIKNFFTGDKSAEDTANNKGEEVGNRYTEGMETSTTSDIFQGILGDGASGIDMSSISGMFNTDGAEAGNNFNLGLGDGLDISSIMGGEMEGFDMSSINGMFNTDGTEAGSNFNLGLGDELDISSIMGGEMEGFDMSSITSSMTTNGNDAGKSFSDGFVNGVDVSSINSILDTIVENIQSKTSDISESGQSMSKAYVESIENMMNDSETAVSNGSSNLTEAFNKIIDSMSKAINDGGKNITDSFKMVIENSLTFVISSIDKFDNASKTLIKNFADGIHAGSESVKKAISVVLASSLAIASSYYGAFYEAGSHVVNGFAAGIEQNDYIAAAKSKAMAEKALDAARDVLDIHSPSKEFQEIGEYSAEGLGKGIKEGTDKPVKEAEKMSKAIKDQVEKSLTTISGSMTYGTGVLKAYVNQYAKFGKSVKANDKIIQDASTSIQNYAKSLYLESDQYKKDTEQLEKHNEELAEYKKQRAEVQAELNKAIANGEKESTIKSLTTKLKNLDDKVDETTKKIVEDSDTAAEHVADAFNKVRDNIKDSVEKTVDVLSSSVDTGIDLFSKFSEASSKISDPFAAVDKKDSISKSTVLNNLSDQVKALDKYEDNVAKLSERDISKPLLQYLKDLGPSGSEYIKTFLSMTDAELSKAGKMYEKTLSSGNTLTAEDVLGNMESQVDGVSKWQKDVAKLYTTDLDKNLVAEIEAKGASGADIVAAYLSMTPEQIQKANETYKKCGELEADTLLNSFGDKLTSTKDWSTNIQALVDNGFNDEFVKKLVESGESTGSKYMNALLSMSKSEIADFNKMFEESLTLPETTADSVIASFIKAGEKSGKSFTDAAKDAASSTSTSTTTNEAGSSIGDSLTDGISSGISENEDTVKESVTDVTNNSVEEVKNTQSKWYDCGKYLLEGLVTGITDNKALLLDTLTAIGNEALANVRNTIDMLKNGDYVDGGQTIKPVVSMDNVNLSSSNLTNKVDAPSVDSDGSLATIMSDIQAKIEESNGTVVTAIKELQEDIDNIFTANDSGEIALYIDAKKMASTLAKDMNQQLSALYKRGK